MRKKYLFLLIGLVITCVETKADIAPTVMLSHNGVKTMFMWDQVQDAVDDAVDGDTIYLSEGTFQPFNVTKRIMVRGAGNKTMIDGNCEVDISGLEKLQMPVLDALSFTGDITVTSAYKQFTIRKCQMQSLNFIKGIFYDVKLDRCNIENELFLTNNVKEFNCFNTKIKSLKPDNYLSGNAYFNHCNIRAIEDTIRATFDYCVLRYCMAWVKGNKYGTCIGGSVLNYCIYPTYNSCLNLGGTYDFSVSGQGAPLFLYNSNVNFNNCYKVRIDKAADVVNYKSSSYLGDDDTMVGCYGGQHPYNRNPEVPGVTKYNLSIDAATRTMKVTLTVDKLAK